MDFAWFAFIGLKMGLSLKETGRITLRMFGRLYRHYKDNWDLEMKLWKSETTYAKAVADSQDDEWF